MSTSRMRLRPSQIVFLLLLACSLQLREDYALRVTVAAISGAPARDGFQPTGVSVAVAPGNPEAIVQSLDRPTQVVGLDSASFAAHRAVWSMRGPALESSAVISFTGLLRA